MRVTKSVGILIVDIENPTKRGPTYIMITVVMHVLLSGTKDQNSHAGIVLKMKSY